MFAADAADAVKDCASSSALTLVSKWCCNCAVDDGRDGDNDDDRRRARKLLDDDDNNDDDNDANDNGRQRIGPLPYGREPALLFLWPAA